MDETHRTSRQTYPFPMPKASSVIATLVVVGLLATLGVLLHLYVKNIAATTCVPISGALLALLIAGVVKHRAKQEESTTASSQGASEPQDKPGEGGAGSVELGTPLEKQYSTCPRLDTYTDEENRTAFPVVVIPKNCDPKVYLSCWGFLAKGQHVIIKSDGVLQMAIQKNNGAEIIPYNDSIVKQGQVISRQILVSIRIASLARLAPPPKICDMEGGRFFVRMKPNFNDTPQGYADYLRACKLYPEPGHYVLLMAFSKVGQGKHERWCQIRQMHICRANGTTTMEWLQGQPNKFDLTQIETLEKKHQCTPMARPTQEQAKEG